MKQPLVLLLFLCFLPCLSEAQVYTNKVVGNKHKTYMDSLRASPYPHVLPIWGGKATEMGYELPLSGGVSVNYFTQKSDLIINNLYVGFNNGPQFNLDEIIRFNSAVSEAAAINIRPDVWLFPFLNIYGIFSKANTSTAIDAGLWLPDTSNVWSEVLEFDSKAKFDATTVGFGLTPTMGVGGGWIALDMNVTWTDVNALDKPTFAFIFGPRIGKSFKFKKPKQNIAIWVGGFRVKYSSSTSGSLPLNEVVQLDGLQEKVDNGIVTVGEKQMNVDEWWNGLSNIEQANPVNKAKYATANRTLEAAGNVLNSIDGALNDGQSATVQYSLDKKLKDLWNFIIGSQFQLNEHIMFRAEYGFLGSRTQFLGSVQYRFGI